MGNCVRKESSMRWAGEDWEGCSSPEVVFSDAGKNRNDEELTSNKSRDHPCFSPSGSSTTTTTTTKTSASAKEVKIKITKTQLEELLGRIDVQGSSVQQVLTQLMNVSHRYEAHQRSWRPVLQCIPEI